MLEVLFLDGGSTDGTPEIITKYAAQYPFIQLLANPEKYVPQAMNKGIAAAKGEVIVRLDAHASYPTDYVGKCVKWLQKTKADNVGGLWKTEKRENTPTAEAIVQVLSHPLGVGNASFRTGVDAPIEVDTVPFGCFRRDVFERFGNYDTRLHRNQDIELNKRIRRGGGKIMLIPEISCTYFARSTYRDLYKNNHANGKWVILTAYFTKTFDSLSWRHFVPFAFVFYVLCATIGSVGAFLYGYAFFALGLLLPLFLYALLVHVFSVKIAMKQNSPSLSLYLFWAFLTLHWSYGIGSFKGIQAVLLGNKV